MNELFKTNGVAYQRPPTAGLPKGLAGRLPPLEPGRAPQGNPRESPLKELLIKVGTAKDNQNKRNTWKGELGRGLPHEWIFGAYLFLTGLRLFLHGNGAQWWGLIFWGMLLWGAAIFFWADSAPTPWRWRVRLLYYPAAMGLSFFAMGLAVPLLGIPPADGLLLRWDRALAGETPALAWEPWLRPWLEDVAMGGYLFFFYYLIAGPGHYCLENLRLFRKCIVGLFTMYGVAFMGYTVLPAGGPHLYLTFNTPLHGPWLLDWTITAVNAASNGLDVFPSVHVAASLYLLLFDWRHGRKRFWWVLLPCAILWFSTMYLRFHYFVDFLAAVILAVASWGMAELYDASANDLPRPVKAKSFTFGFFHRKHAVGSAVFARSFYARASSQPLSSELPGYGPQKA